MVLLDQRQRDIKTLRQNRQALGHLDNWFSLYGIEPATATEEELQTFFAAQSQRYAYNTVKNRLVIVRSLYRWAMRQGAVQTDPTRDVKIGRAPEIEPETLTNEELRSVQAACDTHREYTIFHLLAYTGLRREEVLTLEWSDVNWTTNELKIVGKFGKLRKVPIHPALGEALVQALRRNSSKPAQTAHGSASSPARAFTNDAWLAYSGAPLCISLTETPLREVVRR